MSDDSSKRKALSRTRAVALDQSFKNREWVEALRQASGYELQMRDSTHHGVDVVFVIDTTGSMSNIITALIDTCGRFAEELGASDFDARMAIVAFGDLTIDGDKIVRTPFMPNAASIKQLLSRIPRFSGGGNEGESSFEALEAAWSMDFRPSAIRVLVLLTDEPALLSRLNPASVLTELRSRECVLFVASPNISYFRMVAEHSGGTWQLISAGAQLGHLLDTLRAMASRIRTVVCDVRRLGAGSVATYLRLTSK